MWHHIPKLPLMLCYPIPLNGLWCILPTKLGTFFSGFMQVNTSAPWRGTGLPMDLLFSISVGSDGKNLANFNQKGYDGRYMGVDIVMPMGK